MANVDDFTGRTPDRILSNPLVDSSSWHFFQALSWLDYAKRSQAPSAIHYAAFELRYGIEYLLLELLVLADKKLTLAEYEKCVGDAKKMRKMIEKHSPLFEFTEMALSVGSDGINLRFWNLKELFRYWGIASSYLHSAGAHSRTYRDTNWLIKAIAALETVLTDIWEAVTRTVGIGLLRPSEMKPLVHDAWLEYESGALSKENLRLRLKLIHPAIQMRRGNRF